MWPFSTTKKPEQGTKVTIKIGGMHCSSCALTIDDELEELAGVYKARSSYAKGEVIVRFDPQKVTTKKLESAISKLGYTIETDTVE